MPILADLRPKTYIAFVIRPASAGSVVGRPARSTVIHPHVPTFRKAKLPTRETLEEKMPAIAKAAQLRVAKNRTNEHLRKEDFVFDFQK
jgi:hypothetical protein